MEGHDFDKSEKILSIYNYDIYSAGLGEWLQGSALVVCGGDKVPQGLTLPLDLWLKDPSNSINSKIINTEIPYSDKETEAL